MSGWRDISTAPKDSTPIIIAISGPHGWYIDCATNNFECDGNDTWFARESSEIVAEGNKPSHWQPLPNPPEPA